MEPSEIKILAQKYRFRDLESLIESLFYWQKSIRQWLDEYAFSLKHNLSSETLQICKNAALDCQITVELIRREIISRYDGNTLSVDELEVMEISQRFINHLIDTCLYGGGKVSIENRDSKTTLIIKLAELDCNYRNTGQHASLLQCAVNPTGNCQDCQFKEVK